MAKEMIVQIQQVELDERDSLVVVPEKTNSENFQFIWRDASGVRWDEDRLCFYAWEPEKWEKANFFRQVVLAVKNELGIKLQINRNTKWTNVPIEIREQIER